MKIKCNDYLPSHDGTFMTDLGLLDFHVKPYAYANGNSWHVCNMILDAYPRWWFNPNPKEQ